MSFSGECTWIRHNSMGWRAWSPAHVAPCCTPLLLGRSLLPAGRRRVWKEAPRSAKRRRLANMEGVGARLADAVRGERGPRSHSIRTTGNASVAPRSASGTTTLAARRAPAPFQGVASLPTVANVARKTSFAMATAVPRTRFAATASASGSANRVATGVVPRAARAPAVTGIRPVVSVSVSTSVRARQERRSATRAMGYSFAALKAASARTSAGI